MQNAIEEKHNMKVSFTYTNYNVFIVLLLDGLSWHYAHAKSTIILYQLKAHERTMRKLTEHKKKH